MWVKLLWVTDGYCYECESSVGKGIQDCEWEEIDATTFSELSNYIAHQNKYGARERLVLVRKPLPEEDISITKTVKGFLDYKRKQKLKNEKAEADRKKKEDERKAKLAEKKKEKELKKFLELKEKFGN